MIRFSPEELSCRYGLDFKEDHDDLDRLWLTAIQLVDGSQVWLTRYFHEPEPAITVYADAAADFPATLRALTASLDLSPGDLT